MEKLLNNERPTIPYNKAARVGNYKVWRSKGKRTATPTDEERKKIREESFGKRHAVAKTFDMEYINVSNLDGSWSVKIPATSMMYATICEGYAIENVLERERYLTIIFANFINVTTNTNLALHDGLYFLTEMLSYPYLMLPEKEMKKRMESWLKVQDVENSAIKENINKMTEYRRSLYKLIDKKIKDYIDYYESERLKAKKSEEDALNALKQDELAEQAASIIDEKE